MSLASAMFSTPEGETVYLDPKAVAAVATQGTFTLVFLRGVPTAIALDALDAEVLAAIGWTT